MRRTAPGAPAVARALRDAVPAPLWTDRLTAPAPMPPLEGDQVADLVVVGGGYTGLWTALRALAADPRRSVVLLEAGSCGWAASSRNGGFCSTSLTHGLGNGLARWPQDLATLERLGAANVEGLLTTLDTHGIDCHAERTGELAVAVQPWQLAQLRSLHEEAARLGLGWDWLDAQGMREQVDSPTYLGGTWDPGTVMLDPARLVRGLRDAVVALGGRVHEGSAVRRLAAAGAGVRVSTGAGSVRAPAVVVATNAFASPVRRQRRYVAPVWDYAVATEPLPADVRAALRWSGRQGVADAGNQFHYYRLTEDDRLVWGGYDALWYAGGDTSSRREQRWATTTRLVAHLHETFPQLADVAVTHTWGGVIDTSTRFCAFWAPALGGRVMGVGGFTGLGVGASRFAAGVALDLLDGVDSEVTRLAMVRRRPWPFPPEPARTVAIQATRWATARADAREGRRGPWLRTLDALGLGFDS